MNQTNETEVGISTGVFAWPFAVTVFGVGVVVLLVAYWSTVQSLVWAWENDGTYQYAFLIFPLSLWVAFNLRQQVRANPPAPSVWGLLAVAGMVLIWYVGNVLDVNLLQHFAVVALFPALVLACWGWRALWVLVFPLAYLVVFAVPWGDGLVGPLQDITAHIAVHTLDLTGTPVLLNGREIVTPSAVWMVADACSGVKFFIACSALGCLYAYLMYQRWWKRVLFVAMAAVVPVVANGLRVYFTILIGDTWGLHYATGTDHMIFGWQFFGTVLLLLLLVGWFFRDPLVVREYSRADGAKPLGVRGTVWAAAVVLLVLGPVLAAGLEGPAPAERLHVTAPAVAGWSGPRAAGPGWRPTFNGAAGQVQAAYQAVAGGNVVELFHAIYTGKPRRGHTLITYGNNLYDPEQSKILGSPKRKVELAGGQDLAARELWLTGAAGSRLVWYWYCVDGHCTRSPMLAKALQAWEILRGQVPRSSVWALSAPIDHGDTDQARENLRAFARALPTADVMAAQAQQSPDVVGREP